MQRNEIKIRLRLFFYPFVIFCTVSDKNLENPSSETKEQDEVFSAKEDFEESLKNLPPLEQREE